MSEAKRINIKLRLPLVGDTAIYSVNIKRDDGGMEPIEVCVDYSVIWTEACMREVEHARRTYKEFDPSTGLFV